MNAPPTAPDLMWTRRGRGASTNWPLWDKSLKCVFSSQRASREHLCPVDFPGWEMSGIIAGSRRILLKPCIGAVAVVIATQFEEVAPWGVPLTTHFPPRLLSSACVRCSYYICELLVTIQSVETSGRCRRALWKAEPPVCVPLPLLWYRS